jgi:hypothetical protein
MRLKIILSIPLVLILFFMTAEKSTLQPEPTSPLKNGREFTKEESSSTSLQPPAATGPSIRLMFTGDINLGRYIAKASIRANDFTYPFIFVAEKLGSADITIGSLDGTISDESPPMACPDSMNLMGPEDMVQGLQFAGFDVITVASNHIKDCGEKRV